MAASSLTEVVRKGTPDEEVHLIPVIEKELIHYDVLASLGKMGLLEKLVFHGGTCLRLCYGAQRRSEDLDFAYGGDLEDLNLMLLERHVDELLQEKFGLHATVRPPIKTVEFANAKMQRWWMVVDTAPERPDLPSQRLKIELVSVETFTKEVRRIARNYDYLAPSSGNTLAVCESREEILADKMVAFVNTPPSYVRNRDVWDMAFLLSQPSCRREEALPLALKKMEVYACPLNRKEFAEAGARRVKEVISSSGFEKGMRRFLPKGAFEDLLGTQLKLQFAATEVCELYGMMAGA